MLMAMGAWQIQQSKFPNIYMWFIVVNSCYYTYKESLFKVLSERNSG
jgi:hypothetical protein